MDPAYHSSFGPIVDDDDRTVVTSNRSGRCTAVKFPLVRPPTSIAATARELLGNATTEQLNAMTIATSHAIADTGATSIFVMDGVPVDNKRVASQPLTINLPDGRKVKSTHVCDINIPGLPTMLTGHVVPHLAVASLIGIRPLCNAGCIVTFDKNKCDVLYNDKVILRGYKDAATDLWTLPLTADAMQSALPRSSPVIDCALHDNGTALVHLGVDLATFTHSVRTRANGVKFAHQSLCSPRISTLLKAVRKGFLKGCPNLSEHLILKYLNPSPATTKGHMKRPRHGIRSTSRIALQPERADPAFDVPRVPPPEWMPGPVDFPLPIEGGPNFIADDDESIANMFCYGAFADKRSGVVYNDLTGNFPFVSFDGSICFLVVYHYEANAIFAVPIAGLDDKSIFNAYKKTFDELTQKGFKPKLNIMDNQATRYIRTFLTTEECKLQLVEPHNHRVNAAERAIQTFKDAFISALATTDKDFPLQLWDKLTPQVIVTLNIMRASRIDPTKSAHEVLYGAYDWNRYPLAPLGCRAVVYEDGDTRGSWASRGVDGWYLGPSQDHYRCDVYYIPETRGYRVSGSTELFPQHCQLPDMSPHQHFRALVDEMSEDIDRQSLTPKGRRILSLLRDRITILLAPPPTPEQQRVTLEEQRVTLEEQRVTENERRDREQRVIDDSPILSLPRITEAPGIMNSRNPTAKRMLKNTPRTHRRVTRNNTPGIVAPPVSPPPYVPVPSGAQRRIVTRHAIHSLTATVRESCQRAFTPSRLLTPVVIDEPSHLEHFCSPI